MLTRRRLLQTGVALCAGSALGQAPEVSAGAGSGVVVRARRGEGQAGATIPANFTGLGYEMSSAARLGLLSVGNAPYVQLVRNLGPSGVLRMGGIVADYTRYSAEGTVVSEPKDTVVTRASLEQLRAFLDRVGWTAIWSLNFGRGTLPESTAELRDVARVLGPRLEAVELGNEVENYGRGQAPLRKPPYSYEDFRAEYGRWHGALLRAAPGVRFAAPDTAASVDWVERMAADAHGEVQLLTTHYYRGGQRQGTEEQLMTADAGLRQSLDRLRRASVASGIPWRMCETNSFFGGGRPGLSNTLLGALWTLDYMLLLAANGCAGVNMETGVNQLGFVSSYSPIRDLQIEDDGAGHNTAGAPYYGMLAFAEAVRGAREVSALVMDGGGENLTAYALGAAGRVRSVVVVNRARDAGARVSLEGLGLGLGLGRATALRLTGPALLSETGVLLGGAAVDAGGRWSVGPGGLEAVRGAEVAVPGASAVVIRSA